MEQLQEPEENPPAYSSHDPESLRLPSVPRHPLVSTATTAANNIHLPELRSLGLPDSLPAPNSSNANGHDHGHVLASHQVPPPASGPWHTMPPLQSTEYPLSSALSRGAAEADADSPIDTDRAMSVDRSTYRASSVMSMDDPRERMATEVLASLKHSVQSPSAQSVALSNHTSSPVGSPGSATQHEPEPLLHLLAESHPLIAGTINGSLSAYNSTLSYSPRFVRAGANFVERNIGSPVANTISSVGRRTGVERNIRRYLGSRRRASDLEQGHAEPGVGEMPELVNGHKRRRVTNAEEDPMEVDGDHPDAQGLNGRSRGNSQVSNTESLLSRASTETLPAYDADKTSPHYEESSPRENQRSLVLMGQDADASRRRRVHWSTQLVISTYGLGASFSKASLSSLRMCLRFLREATTRIGTTMRALKIVIEEYEREMQSRQEQNGDATMVNGASTARLSEQEERAQRMADRIKILGADIWTTLKSVVHNVSRLTAGLPERAGELVRTQLMNLPERWRAHTASSEAQANGGGEDNITTAKRVMAFAKDGLEAIALITDVVDDTVQSAERWLARTGRKHRRDDGPDDIGETPRDNKRLEVTPPEKPQKW